MMHITLSKTSSNGCGALRSPGEFCYLSVKTRSSIVSLCEIELDRQRVIIKRRSVSLAH